MVRALHTTHNHSTSLAQYRPEPLTTCQLSVVYGVSRYSLPRREHRSTKDVCIYSQMMYIFVRHDKIQASLDCY